MGFATTAFAAQDAIVSALTAAPQLAAWQVDFGLPPVRQEQHIWVDDTIDEGTQETATSGLVTKNESFRLTVYVYSRLSGATALEIRDEITTAAGVVADVIGSEPFLGGTVLFAEVVGFEYGGAFANETGTVREAAMKITVACQSFLTA